MRSTSVAKLQRQEITVASETFEGPGLPLGWTLNGTGGLSKAVTGVRPRQGHQFAWIDNSGGVDMSDIPIPPVVHYMRVTTGSKLWSPAFTIGSGLVLQMDLDFLSEDGSARCEDFAEVVLFFSGTAVATLYLAQAGSETAADPDLVPAAVSPGVTLSPATANFRGNRVGPIGGVTYGPIRNPAGVAGWGPHPGGDIGWVRSSYSPPAGTYQLLFAVSNDVDSKGRSALLIDSVFLTQTTP